MAGKWIRLVCLAVRKDYNACMAVCNMNNTVWNNVCALFNRTNTYGDCLHQCNENEAWNENACYLGNPCYDDTCVASN